MTKIWQQFSIWIVALLVVVLVLPGVQELFKPGYYTSHDGEGHVIRMDEFYRAIRDGHFPVRWSQRLYYGYGYPFFNFNYPLTYYLGVPPMALGFSATDAMKAETVVTYVFSAVLMFLYLRRKVSWQYAVLGAAVYSYAPYRMLNIFVRGSVAEAAAFLFPPLLLWAAENFHFRRPKTIAWGALIIFFLGISHNISALLLFGFFFVYLIILSVFRKSLQPFLAGCVAFGLGLMMAAFFFVPALLEKKITFLDQTIAKDYPDHFIYLPQFLRSGWDFGSSVAGPKDGLSFNIGWVSTAAAAVAAVVIFIKKRKTLKSFFFADADRALLTFCIVMFLGAIFFMLPPARMLWDTLPLLPFVQFPWRFLMLTVPVLAILCALLVEKMVKILRLSQPISIALCTVLVAVSMFIAKDQWHINQVIYPKTYAGDALEGSTTWADEQATQWLVPKPNKIPAQHVEFVPANSAVTIENWKTAAHQYSFTLKQPTKVIENTMYYPGWIATVNGADQPIEYQDSAFPGRIVYSLPAGEYRVRTQLTEAPMRRAMDTLSLVSLVAVIGFLLLPTKSAVKKRK